MSIVSNVNLIDRMSGKISNTLVAVVPKVTISNKKALEKIDWIGEHFSSPENRLILGVSALMTQPFIDGSNKKVDEETRRVSVARTVAKIIAGTLTGYFVRAGCIKLIDEMTKLPSEVNTKKLSGKLKILFTPDVAKNGKLKDLKKYKNALGTTLSLGVMMFTNFMIDAPLTKFLTNFFTDKMNAQANKKQENKS